eukprot:m.675669 g.675669  ORF g.675669 m.675669 type:complete len:98 (-) comp58554_c0_seq23:218-511(-)
MPSGSMPLTTRKSCSRTAELTSKSNPKTCSSILLPLMCPRLLCFLIDFLCDFLDFGGVRGAPGMCLTQSSTFTWFRRHDSRREQARLLGLVLASDDD